MSDLTVKFETLEAQLADQHTDIVNGINAILAALGAPPPGDLITLDDIATQLNTINTNLLGIQSDNSAFYSSMLSVAGVISTNVETMLYNNSTNTQAVIAAIYTTSCACPSPSALLPLPIDVTPTELVDEAKCRRIQYYLALFGSWLTKIANYGSAAGFVTGDTLGALLGLAAAEAGLVATGAEVGAAAGPPGIVVGAVIGLISGAIFTLGGSVLVDYANQFNDPILRAAMVEAMFAATNADEGYTAFKETILANMSTIPAEIIYTLWWTAWSNDVYSGSPVVDDSAFDGTICTEDSGVIILTESCGDLINQVFGGSYDSGLRNILPYTHFKLGAASAGSGTVKLYVDDVLVLTVDVDNDGLDKTWIGTGTNARVISAMSADTYVHFQACTGTYGPG